MYFMLVFLLRFDRVRLPNEIGIPDDGQTKDFSGDEYKTSKRYLYIDFLFFQI